MENTQELTVGEKFEKLGIRVTRQFGEKHRKLLKKINKDNNGGEYVGYQLNVHQDKLTVIGKTGTAEYLITDYGDIDNGLYGLSSKSVHYGQGGNTPKSFNYSIGGL